MTGQGKIETYNRKYTADRGVLEIDLRSQLGLRVKDVITERNGKTPKERNGRGRIGR